MANITEFLNRIRSAIYGEEVRGSIISSIEAINQEATSAREAANRSAESAEESKEQVDEALRHAEECSDAAKNSETASRQSAEASAASAESAENSKQNAEASKEAAQSAAEAAAQSAQNAAQTLESSRTIEQTAQNAAGAAAQSAEASGNSAAAAKASEDAAKESADAAKAVEELVDNLGVEVTTLEANEKATGDVENIGNSKILKLGIPKGRDGKNFKILAIYETLELLNQKVPSPEQGDFYSVGAEAPYSIYMWDTTLGWVYQGVIGTGESQGTSLPDGGATGQVLMKNSAGDGDASWKDLPEAEDELPVGGAVGQVLVKKTNVNGDVEWKTLDAPGVGAVYLPNEENPTYGVATGINADTFGGKAPEYYASKTVVDQLSQQKADKAGWTANKIIGTDANGNLVAQDPPESDGGDADTLSGKAPAYYTPYTNLADNSDFTHWIAQAGIGGKHGTQAYGGDRWILTSGTIVSEGNGGNMNADGDGYSGMRLNGTLVQVVPSPPSVATAFVEMVSGTAEISYDASKGEIVLTSAGGVIKNVLLLEGEWTEKPEYVSKGYASELAECQLYYYNYPSADFSLMGKLSVLANTASVAIPVPLNMRKTPNIAKGSNFVGYIYHPTDGSYTTLTGITVDKMAGNIIVCDASLSESFSAAYMLVTVRLIGTFGFVADIDRR